MPNCEKCKKPEEKCECCVLFPPPELTEEEEQALIEQEEKEDQEFRDKLASITTAKEEAFQIFDLLSSVGLSQYQPIFDLLTYDDVWEFFYTREIELEKSLEKEGLYQP